MMVMRILGLAADPDAVTPFNGEYYVSSKFGPGFGEGDLNTTRDINKAKRFETLVELRDEWAKVDENFPVRPDGQPNRPLTAWTIEVLQVPEEGAYC
jgi:hypothetical protein